MSANDLSDPNHQNYGFVDNHSYGSKEYEYDPNGNMVFDNNKKLIDVKYNYLNLPTRLILNRGSDFDQIFYQYDAAGNKLCKQATKSGMVVNTTRYFPTFETESGHLKHIFTAEGKAVPMKKGFEYQYFIKDHLGNTRVVLSQTNEVLQQNSYYPFGMLMAGLPQKDEANTNKYLYNGKELQDDFGLDWYDYGARFYDAEVGRWHVMDRFAEKFINESPYSYALNNPSANIDINGDTTYRFDNSTGAYLGMHDLDAAGQRGSYGTTKTIGKGKDKQEVWDGQYFDFADPVNDSQDLRDGTITKLVLVSEEDMQSLLESQGAFKSGKLNFGWQSQGGGDFDYSYTALPKKYPDANFDGNTMKSNSLFLPKGDNTAHNFMNFGNYLWGATGYTVGFNYAGLQSGAHANSLLNSKRNGYPAQWDSKDDQRSIKKGIYHAQIHNYRKLKK